MKSLAGCIFLLILLPALSFAAEVGLSGTTLLRFEERSVPGFDKQTVLPATQYIGLDAEKIGKDGNLSLHLYGWGRVDLADKSTDEGSTDGNFSYGYLLYRFPTANGTVKLGRFFLYEGVAAEQIDGVAAGTDLQKGFYLSVFGGIPTKLDRNSDSKGDYIFGGRLSWRMASLFEVGFSGLQEGKVTLLSGGKDDRQMIGGDVWFSPHRMVELTGHTFYNAGTSGVAEHSYLLNLKPLTGLYLSGTYNEQNVKDYFTYANANWLYTGNPNKDFLNTTSDSFKSYGASATYQLLKPLEVTLEYKHYKRKTVEANGDSDRFGGETRLTLLDNRLRAGLSYYRVRAVTGIKSYNEFRGYLFHDFQRYIASVDAIIDIYDNKIYTKKSAYEISASLGYKLLANLRVSGDLGYTANPQYKDELKGLLRLTFNYNTSFKGAGL